MEIGGTPEQACETANALSQRGRRRLLARCHPYYLHFVPRAGRSPSRLWRNIGPRLRCRHLVRQRRVVPVNVHSRRVEHIQSLFPRAERVRVRLGAELHSAGEAQEVDASLVGLRRASGLSGGAFAAAYGARKTSPQASINIQFHLHRRPFARPLPRRISVKNVPVAFGPLLSAGPPPHPTDIITTHSSRNITLPLPQSPFPSLPDPPPSRLARSSSTRTRRRSPRVHQRLPLSFSHLGHLHLSTRTSDCQPCQSQGARGGGVHRAENHDEGGGS